MVQLQQAALYQPLDSSCRRFLAVPNRYRRNWADMEPVEVFLQMNRHDVWVLPQLELARRARFSADPDQPRHASLPYSKISKPLEEMGQNSLQHQR